MQKKILYGLLILLPLVALYMFWPKELQTPTEIDLGEVALTSQRAFTVKVTNPSLKTYEIAKIYTSCGCTNSTTKVLTLKPGASFNVDFNFDPASMHAQGDTINHEIYFLVGSPVEKEYIVKLTGTVI